MIYRGAELYNVTELLQGDLASVLSPEALTALGEPGTPPWETGPGSAAQGLWFCRIPDKLRRGLHFRGQIAGLAASGSELRFNLRGERGALVLKALEAPAVVEVWQGSFLSEWQVVEQEPTTISIQLPEHQSALVKVAAAASLPFDPALTRVVLPWRRPVKLIDFRGDVEPPRPGQTPALRYLAYGSSITHGARAIRPTGTYAQRCAQRLGADLINMGFGGGAKLEPEMAAYLAGRQDWDFATLEMGINLVSFIEPGEFEGLVDNFVERIVAGHRDKPVFCIDLFPCRQELENPAKVAAFRRIVADKVASMRSPRVTHLSGPSLLEGFGGLSADLLHPSPMGMEQIGERLAARIKERL